MQMAIDRWLFEQHLNGQHPPTLRFYTWSPAAISLGYHQRHWPEHWRSLIWQDRPVELVRRPTGGRAVLHQGDLTYGLIASDGGRNRLNSYQHFCQFLVDGWRSLGVELTYGTAGRGYIGKTNCFGMATGADLVTVSGYKLIGSAQLRKRQTVLQHGSMRLNPSPALYQSVFGDGEGKAQIEPPSVLANLAIASVMQALVQSAENCYGITLTEQPLSRWEWQAIQTLSQEYLPNHVKSPIT